MEELKYIQEFMTQNEVHYHTYLVRLLGDIFKSEFQKATTYNAAVGFEKELNNEIAEIVETVLIRHLELWAESLVEEVEVDEHNYFVLDGKMYTGILYREKAVEGSIRYYTSPTDNTVEILYAKEGDVAYYDIPENVVQYVGKDAWYLVETVKEKVIFNLNGNNPIAIKTSGKPSKLDFPMVAISNIIADYGIVSEMQ